MIQLNIKTTPTMMMHHADLLGCVKLVQKLEVWRAKCRSQSDNIFIIKKIIIVTSLSSLMLLFTSFSTKRSSCTSSSLSSSTLFHQPSNLGCNCKRSNLIGWSLSSEQAGQLQQKPQVSWSFSQCGWMDQWVNGVASWIGGSDRMNQIEWQHLQTNDNL